MSAPGSSGGATVASPLAASLSSAEVLAGHLDVAAQGQQADLVVGVAEFNAEETRAEAEGEGLDADPAELGDGKVAKLVDHNHDTDEDDEGDDIAKASNQKIMHRSAVIPSVKQWAVDSEQ